MARLAQEPLLHEDDSRFVMFPVQYGDVWDMYKNKLTAFGGLKKLICLKI